MNNEVKKYINSLDISEEDKRDFYNFSIRKDYLSRLMSKLIKETNQKVSFGYGNYNSKICFIFDTKEYESDMEDMVFNFLKSLNIDRYSIYITYVDKAKDYNKKYELLANELNAIRPKIIYYFGEGNLDELNRIYSQITEVPKEYIIPKDTFNKSKKKLNDMIKYKDILRRN